MKAASLRDIILRGCRLAFAACDAYGRRALFSMLPPFGWIAGIPLLAVAYVLEPLTETAQEGVQ